MGLTFQWYMGLATGLVLGFVIYRMLIWWINQRLRR